MRHLLVRDIMSHPAHVIEWRASVMDAAGLLESLNVRRLPVVDDDGVIMGVISLGDVREATSIHSTVSPYAPEQDEILLAVDEVMTSPPITLNPDATLKSAVELMLAHKIGGVPIVDEAGRPLGIITESDVFRLLVEQWDEDA